MGARTDLPVPSQPVLDHLQLRPLQFANSPFEPIGLALGNGPSALEVVVARYHRQPGERLTLAVVEDFRRQVEDLKAQLREEAGEDPGLVQLKGSGGQPGHMSDPMLERYTEVSSQRQRISEAAAALPRCPGTGIGVRMREKVDLALIRPVEFRPAATVGCPVAGF